MDNDKKILFLIRCNNVNIMMDNVIIALRENLYGFDSDIAIDHDNDVYITSFDLWLKTYLDKNIDIISHKLAEYISIYDSHIDTIINKNLDDYKIILYFGGFRKISKLAKKIDLAKSGGWDVHVINIIRFNQVEKMKNFQIIKGKNYNSKTNISNEFYLGMCDTGEYRFLR